MEYSEKGKADDIWMYLPKNLKTVRITSRDPDQSFMGSDLTYADMGQRGLDEDDHRLVDERKLNGVQCYFIRSIPKKEDDMYGKKEYWISKKDFRTLKIDYFEKNGKLLKTQMIEWQEEGKAIVYKKMVVDNHKDDHQTVYEIKNLKINVGLEDSDFTRRVLESGEIIID